MVPESVPHFPGLPEDYWTGGVNDAAVQAFRDETLRWREHVSGWLSGEHAHARLSAGLIDFLLWTVREREGPEFDAAPYHVRAFPERRHTDDRGSATEGAITPADHALDVLVWRALVVDFLADVWDTIGSPRFDMEECARATELFMPEEHDDARHCAYCLGEYADALDPATHNATCPIQRDAMMIRWGEVG